MTDNGISLIGTDPLRLRLTRRASDAFPLQDVIYKTMVSADEAHALVWLETKEGPMIVLAVLGTLHPPEKLWEAFEKYARDNLVVTFAQGINNVRPFENPPKPRRDPGDTATN